MQRVCCRCAVLVDDICQVVVHIVSLYPDLPAHSTYNLGGPDRLSRLDMAMAVAQHLGYDTACVQECLSASVQRCVQSPMLVCQSQQAHAGQHVMQNRNQAGLLSQSQYAADVDQ